MPPKKTSISRVPQPFGMITAPAMPSQKNTVNGFTVFSKKPRSHHAK